MIPHVERENYDIVDSVQREQEGKMSITAGIAGSGSCMPKALISNQELANLIKREGKGADWAEEKLGIKSRRFLTRLDEDGKPVGSADELDMAFAAAKIAIADAGLQPCDIDLIWYISCTQKGHERHHFSTSAFTLHRMLGLCEHAVPLEMDAGCGGALHAMALASKFIESGAHHNVLIVASSAPSRYYDDWEQYRNEDVWLSMYIFGDGAGAVVLRRTDELNSPLRSPSVVKATFLGVDPDKPLMWYRTQGVSERPLYVIDGRGVALGFGKYAKRALGGLQAVYPFDYRDVARYYFHQVNGKVLQDFVAQEGIQQDRVAMHVDHYGNIAAAATLVLLDEDRMLGYATSGDLCVFCTVGAGAQYGAMLVQL